jgi:hypothetical protein
MMATSKKLSFTADIAVDNSFVINVCLLVASEMLVALDKVNVNNSNEFGILVDRVHPFHNTGDHT